MQKILLHFRAEYIRFVSVISRLNVDHKKKLKDIMDTIGGIVIDCYDNNCTHLTATTASSTSKVCFGSNFVFFSMVMLDDVTNKF